jgi:asparagine synthase (glutamine-hydrolysing)
MLIAGIYWINTANRQYILSKLSSLFSTKDEKDISRISYPNLDCIVHNTTKTHNQVTRLNNFIFMGRMFDKTSFEPILFSCLDSNKYQQISQFVDQFWGEYLLIKINKENHEVELFRDPSGRKTLFYTYLENDCLIFSSEISLIFELLDQVPASYMPYLCAYLKHGRLNTEYTPFENIFEIPMGCCLKLTHCTKALSVLWDPCNANILKNQGHTDLNLIETFSNSLEKLVAHRKNLFLDFSGGLDSTVTLHSLKNKYHDDKDIHCINIFHPEIAASNELNHAIPITDKLNVKLIKFNISTCLPFSAVAKLLQKPNKPSPILIYQKQEQNIAEIAGGHEDYAFLSGHGGDHVFMSSPLIESLCDWFLVKGPRKIVHKFVQLATYYRCSLLTLTKLFLKNLLLYYKGNQLSAYLHNSKISWLNEKFKINSASFLHPYFARNTSTILPGALQRMRYLYDALAINLDIRNPYEPIYHPMLAQPFIEQAFSYFSYDLYDDVYDRLPLRKAATHTFNSNYFWRQDKGHTTGILQLGLKQNLAYVLSLCLEGKMANSGLINKDLLYKSIKTIANGDFMNSWPFMHLFSLEQFLSYWP